MRAYSLDPHNSDYSQLHDEITSIVAKQGLSKPRRRRSSAKIESMNRWNGNTVIEYHEDRGLDEEQNPCQAEFNRFLRDNFSFANCMTSYLKRFKSAELNDIRYLVAMDKSTLIKDVKMSPVHATVLMSRIDKFKVRHSIVLSLDLFLLNGIAVETI